MKEIFQDINKICNNCQKKFIITAQEQDMALNKGGKIFRSYCRECLKKWRRGEIKLENN